MKKSFYYLKHVPFDILKLDGEFVRGAAADRTDRLVVDVVAQLAAGLERPLVAECIEDEDTVAVLLRHGVTTGQGYHLGMPAAVERWVRSG